MIVDRMIIGTYVIFLRPGQCSDSEVDLHQFSKNLIVLNQGEEKVEHFRQIPKKRTKGAKKEF